MSKTLTNMYKLYTGDVVALKMFTGMEIIGTFEVETDEYIVLEKAVMLVLQQINNTDVAPAFMPISQMSKLDSYERPMIKATIPKNMILTPFALDADLEKVYREKSSDIVIASAGSIR